MLPDTPVGESSFLRRLLGVLKPRNGHVTLKTEAQQNAIALVEGRLADLTADEYHAANSPPSETAYRWIPVSDERRPEIGVCVLTFNDFDRCTYSAEWTGDGWSHFCGDGSAKYQIRNVTHWRPCQEQPK